MKKKRKKNCKNPLYNTYAIDPSEKDFEENFNTFQSMYKEYLNEDKEKEEKEKQNYQSTNAALKLRTKTYLKLLNEELMDVEYSPDEKKAHFKWLYNLFGQINSKEFDPWERTSFFGKWFTVISNEYMKAFMKYNLSLKQYFSQKKTGKFTVPALGEANIISFLTNLVLRLPVDDLIEDTVKCGQHSIFPPAKVFTIEEIKRELFNLNRFKRLYLNHGYASLRFQRINIQYPTEIILEKMRIIIEQEKQKYFSYFPEREPLVRKKTAKGIRDVTANSYRFDEWERYLKVYMLKQQGVTSKTIGDQFYSKNQDPLRQVKRDNQKAKILSNNAVAGNFPGKY